MAEADIYIYVWIVPDLTKPEILTSLIIETISFNLLYAFSPQYLNTIF